MFPLAVAKTFTPGERYEEMQQWTAPPPEVPGVWNFLGWRRTKMEPGRVEMEWEPNENHGFPAGDGYIIHGGMVTAILDTAMGGATWTLLDLNEVFLTADLRTEFYRPTLPGLVRAEGRVIHKTRRVTFAEAELFDSEGRLLAAGRATNLSIDLTDPRDLSKRGPATPERG
jgi:uncharacterized protein (TIGR00369 family)